MRGQQNDTMSVDRLLDDLTPREQEVLRLMSAGSSNREIADALVITVDTVRWYSKQIYSKLGVHGRTEAVLRAGELGLLDGKTAQPATNGSTIQLQRHNLPAHLTNLLGREDELAAIGDLLSGCRLVTLTGPGGVGKTRLSQAFAATQIDQYADGVYFVELATIIKPERVADAIAATLQLAEIGTTSSEDLLEGFLRKRHMLLVLDNFEQIIGAAPLVDRLLAAAPRTHMLVTSREVLHIYGECEYALQPLTLPAQTITPEELLQSPAVRLFVQRARAVRRDFELTAENASTVAEICTRLDGLPLALELAAARIRLFSPQTLLERLDTRLTSIKSAVRNTPGRQQTLRTTIDWSYNLLNDVEKTLFARLGGFSGGCDAEAVEVIAGYDLPHETLDCLESLLSKSLVQQKVDATGEVRFVMLETIYEYARECLAEHDQADVIYRRHAEYFTELGEQAATFYRGHGEHLWMKRLEVEHDNLRAALRWAYDHDIQLAGRLVTALGHYWYAWGHHHEGRRWIDRLVARIGELHPAQHSPLLTVGGKLAFVQGDRAGGQQMQEWAVAKAQAIGNPVQIAWAQLLFAASSIGQPETAAEALALTHTVRQVFEQHQHTRALAQTYNILGELARTLGDYESARTHYITCLEISRENGELDRVRMCLENLSFVAYHAGDFDTALDYAHSALNAALDLENLTSIMMSLHVIAGPLAALGHPVDAAKLFSAGEKLMSARGLVHQFGDLFEVALYDKNIRQQLSEADFQEAWAEGQQLSLDQTVALALQLNGADQQ